VEFLDQSLLTLNFEKDIQQASVTLCRSISSEFPFDYCIALDSWLYPIREEAKKLAEDFAGNPKIIFINCEVFQVIIISN